MVKKVRIGLQISSIDTGYKMEVFDTIKEYCAKKEYDLVLFPGGSQNSSVYPYQQTSIYSHITKKNIDSLIIISSQYLKQNIKSNVPTLCICEETKEIPCVTADFKKEYAEIITHMRCAALAV